MKFKGRSITSIQRFTKDEMEYIMRKSKMFEDALAEGDEDIFHLNNSVDFRVASLFFEPSTRTQTSFNDAIELIGGTLRSVSGTATTSLSKGESLRKTLEMYVVYGYKAIVMRHVLDGSAALAAEVLSRHNIPVLNGGDGKHEHPTQTILDRYALLKIFDRLRDDSEHAYSLEGKTIMMMNDLKYGRVPHSNLEQFSRYENVKFIFAAPEMLQLPESYLKLLEQRGCEYELTDTLDKKLLAEADVIMVFRPQRERFGQIDRDEVDRILGSFVITPELMDKYGKPGAKVLHPLPIDDRYPEIDRRLDDTEWAFYFQQAAGGLPTRMVELAMVTGLIGDDFEGDMYSEPDIDRGFWEERADHDAKSSDGSGYSIKPVQTGTSIDHLPVGSALKLIPLLGVSKGDLYREGTVGRKSSPGAKKDVIVLENRVLDDKYLALIAVVTSGTGAGGRDVTVNTIHEGVITRKQDITALPYRMEGIGRCSNIILDEDYVLKGGCITRFQKEGVGSRFESAGNGLLRCVYCDNIMQSPAIFDK